MKLLSANDGFANRWYRKVGKDLFDRVMALLMLAILMPIMILIALSVRIILGPGIIFVQPRVGYMGIVFDCYKFRTMSNDRRECVVNVQVERRRPVPSANDPRKTAFGGFLRRYSLDELPQLFNVLCGDMSLVGPRPEIPRVYALYTEYEQKRTLAKPGITGYWQVTGRSTNIDLRESTDDDVAYIANISFVNDLCILLKTPVAMLAMPAATECGRDST